MVHLWLTYGPLRWVGAVWQSETVHLGEPVRTNINQSFIYQRVCHLPSLGNGLIFGTVWKWTNFSLIIYPLRQYQQNNHVKLSHKDTRTLTGKNLFNLNGKNTRTTTMGIALVSLWLTLIKYLPTRTVW